MFKLAIPPTLKNSVAESDFKLFAAAKKDDGPAELLVMDDIGDSWFGEGIKAKDVSAFVKDNAGREIHVKINSFGGDAYDGLSIYNSLSQHDAKVTTENLGIAFSAASVIFAAGEERLAHEASDFGIHRASVGAYGPASSMRAMAAWLDSLDSHLIEVYQSITGISESDLTAYVDGEDGVTGTVFGGKDAVEKGFATKLIPAKKRTKNEIEQGIVAVRRLAAEHNLRLSQSRRRA